MDNQLSEAKAPVVSVIRNLRQAIINGKHWYIALLEAIGLWTACEEVCNARRYHYLIAGEAFDWLLLAERLCETVADLLPDGERTTLLFHGIPPLELTTAEFKELIGPSKYCQYLNYFYGVTVEEALIQAVLEEVRKSRGGLGYNHDYDDEVYSQIYDATKSELLRQFRQERGHPQVETISLSELREFTYWLFKYRLKHCDKARVASDTKKGLEHLRQRRDGFTRRLVAELPSTVP